jgi:hypothetical protein
MIELAKELINRGITLDDQELISMGIKLLEKHGLESGDKPVLDQREEAPLLKVAKPKARPSSKTTTPKVERPTQTSVAEKNVRKKKKSVIDQFTLPPKDATIRYVPVKWTGVNNFVDDQSECVGEEFETPNFKPVRRTRERAEKVEVFCGLDENGEKRDENEGCGKSVLCSPELIREFFLCDDCILEKTKGR